MLKKISAIIAHYDPNGDVPLDLIRLISDLKKLSNEIIFVSTNINKKSAEIIKKWCILIERENFGYDFWSYKVGIDRLSDKKNLDSILLINSSVIYFDSDKLLKNFFNNSPNYPALHGLTDSHQNGHHIQSFWIEFCTNDLINSKAFDVWWSELTPISDQIEIIKRYEIGMSQYFKSLNIKLEALYKKTPENKVLAACRCISDDHYDFYSNSEVIDGKNFSLPVGLADKINPTSILWDIILDKFDWIKVKTFDRENRDFRRYKFLKYLEKNIDHLERNIGILASRNIDILSKK